MLLSAIGIFLIVNMHCYYPIVPSNSLIPYRSCIVPLFVFISGYFNKVDNTTKLSQYIRKKEYSLLLPYFVIVFITFWIEQGIIWFKTSTAPVISIENIRDTIIVSSISILTNGFPVDISGPVWFIPSLFSVLIIYAVLKKLFYKIWNSIVVFCIFCLLNIAVVWVSKRYGIELVYLLPLKCLFFLPFIEFGIIYREYIETKICKMDVSRKCALIISLIIVNSFRAMALPKPDDIDAGAFYNLSGFSSPYPVTPLVSSILVILFWTTLVDLIGRPFYEIKIVNYISENTLYIMGYHFVFFNLLNCILKIIHSYFFSLPDFNNELFSQSNYYFWNYKGRFCLVYLFVGLFGPITIKYIVDKSVNCCKNRKNEDGRHSVCR